MPNKAVDIPKYSNVEDRELEKITKQRGLQIQGPQNGKNLTMVAAVGGILKCNAMMA